MSACHRWQDVVSKLSGGERRRLQVGREGSQPASFFGPTPIHPSIRHACPRSLTTRACCCVVLVVVCQLLWVLVQRPNFLVLDEPTNVRAIRTTSSPPPMDLPPWGDHHCLGSICSTVIGRVGPWRSGVHPILSVSLCVWLAAGRAAPPPPLPPPPAPRPQDLVSLSLHTTQRLARRSACPGWLAGCLTACLSVGVVSWCGRAGPADAGVPGGVPNAGVPGRTHHRQPRPTLHGQGQQPADTATDRPADRGMGYGRVRSGRERGLGRPWRTARPGLRR